MSKTNVAIPEYLKKYMDNGSGKDADSMASASVSVPRISLKGKKFMFMNGDDESKKTDEIHVVILGVDPEGGRMIKTFYAGGYNPNDTAPPDCSSSNGVTPDAWVNNPISTNCAGCQKNVFGSATSATGKKTKACRDAKRLWVAKVDDIEGVVYGLNVPVTSLKAMSEYGREIRGAGVPLSAVITKLTMDEDAEFPQLIFERFGFLNEETGLKALERNESRDWMESINLRNALPAPAQDQVKQERLADRKVSSDTIDGESRKVDSAEVDEAAKDW